MTKQTHLQPNLPHAELLQWVEMQMGQVVNFLLTTMEKTPMNASPLTMTESLGAPLLTTTPKTTYGESVQVYSQVKCSMTKQSSPKE